MKWQWLALVGTLLPPSARYLVLTWLVPAEVGRVEIAWTTAD